jgi:hypothetical protein
LSEGQIWLNAEYSLLTAMFSKTVRNATFPLWSESLTLPFIRLDVKHKPPLRLIKNSDSHGVEQAFMPAVRTKEEGPPCAAGAEQRS